MWCAVSTAVRRGIWPVGTVVHGFITFTLTELDCSKKKGLLAMFAPVFRIWIEGREDDSTTIDLEKRLTPLYERHVWLFAPLHERRVWVLMSLYERRVRMFISLYKWRVCLLVSLSNDVCGCL